MGILQKYEHGEFNDEDTLALIADMHFAHIGSSLLIDRLDKELKQFTESEYIDHYLLWHGIIMCLRRAFNTGATKSSGRKPYYPIKRENVQTFLNDHGWASTEGRDFNYFFDIGNKRVAHGNPVPGEYEVANKDGVLELTIKLPDIQVLKEFEEMCLTIECELRELTGLDPESDFGQITE